MNTRKPISRQAAKPALMGWASTLAVAALDGTAIGLRTVLGKG